MRFAQHSRPGLFNRRPTGQIRPVKGFGMALGGIPIYLSHTLAAKASRELPPLFPIHSQIPSFPEAHAVEVPTELLSPGSPGPTTGAFPTRAHGALMAWCNHAMHAACSSLAVMT